MSATTDHTVVVLSIAEATAVLALARRAAPESVDDLEVVTRLSVLLAAARARRAQ